VAGYLLIPVPHNLLVHLPGLGGWQPVDNDVGVPDGLLQVGDDLERAERRVEHVETEAVAEDQVGVERAVPEPRLDVLEVHAVADEAAQHVLAGVDDIKEVLGISAVDGAPGAVPHAHLHTVPVLAVRILQQHAEGAPPRPSAHPDHAQRVAVHLPQPPSSSSLALAPVADSSWRLVPGLWV
jgi:hypothetical protein